ncbi:MAG TPA: hypothetical protein VJA94_20470 [Candidatus Angelobacter sp.]
MRRHPAALLICLAVTGLFTSPLLAQNTAGGWKEYSYSADGFAVSAPAAPAFTRQDQPTGTGPVETHNYAIELGHNSGVMISAAQVQSMKSDSVKTNLQNAKEGAIRAVNGKLISEHEITLQGIPGIEFEAANDQFHTRVRMYLLNKRLITMMMIAPREAAYAAGADRVFASFKLLGVAGK